MALNKVQKAYVKVANTIGSGETETHIRVAENMLVLFQKLFPQEQNKYTKLFFLLQIRRIELNIEPLLTLA